jgi:hypothetical protein
MSGGMNSSGHHHRRKQAPHDQPRTQPPDLTSLAPDDRHRQTDRPGKGQPQSPQPGQAAVRTQRTPLPQGPTAPPQADQTLGRLRHNAA